MFWFPVVTERFCDELVAEMENYGSWSDGSNSVSIRSQSLDVVQTNYIATNRFSWMKNDVTLCSSASVIALSTFINIENLSTRLFWLVFRLDLMFLVDSVLSGDRKHPYIRTFVISWLNLRYEHPFDILINFQVSIEQTRSNYIHFS